LQSIIISEDYKQLNTFETHKMIERLKNSVEKKIGKKISCQKDCKLLSNNILEAIGEYISPATLRRVFGLLLTNSNPSRVTHDILSRFIGYDNWDHFTELNREQSGIQNHLIGTWERALEKSKKISAGTVDNIKRKSGINFNKTVHRQFAEERMGFLLKSDYSATALIGPGGYGKSTLLANWFIKYSAKKNTDPDIILFLPALSLSTFANAEVYFEDWLIRQLGLSPDNNFLNNIQNSNLTPPGKFILIIDALDESNLQGSKIEMLYSSIANFSNKFSSCNWLKIIISTRLYAWNKFRPFIVNNANWFYTDPSVFSAEGANMPLLTSDESQKILDNTVNTKFSSRTLLQEFSMELKETLSYPYFLQLFIAVYHPENEYMLNDQIEIFREFLNKQVYKAQYSEEKLDILNKIIELSDFGLNPDDVKKNTIKEFYPIHLKLAGNYFAAYEELISFGIIVEEDIENRYGGHSKIIKVANRNLYSTLLAQNYLEKEEEVSITLFQKIEKKYANHELLPHLINRLYQFVYKDRILSPLKKFFDLNHHTLDAVLQYPIIATTLRKDDYLRKILLPIYSKNPQARKYLFEDFPDTNNLCGSFSISLNHYASHCTNPEEVIYANIYNVYAGFLALDAGRVERYYKQIENIVPSINHNPSVIGQLFACRCMYKILLKKEDPKSTIDQATVYLKKIKSLKGYKYDSFESYFFNALILTGQFDPLAQVIKKDKTGEAKLSTPIANEIQIYRLFSKLISGNKIDLSDIIEIDLILSQLNPMNSYAPQILGQLLKASHYLNSNEITKAYECFRNSTELSNLAGYKIAEVKLMKNLSNVLLQLGEKAKSIECNNFAEGLTKKTGFDYNML